MERRSTEPQIAKYLHAKGRALGLPISGTFELTARCNFNCPMCYVHETIPQGELNAAQWIHLAQQARDAGMVFALLTGGEPLIRRDFFEIYGAMKKMGLLVSINTNGSLLHGETLQRLLEDPPYRVNLSLYGGSGQTYRDMCGQDAFRRVVSAIRSLKTAGVDVRLNLSITPYNRQDLEKIWNISQELGVHVKASAYMYPPLRVAGRGSARLTAQEAAEATLAWDTLRLSPQELAQRRAALAALESVEPPECPVEEEPGMGCRGGSTAFWLTWRGQLTPCGMMPQPVTYPLETDFAQAWQQLRRETGAIRTPTTCANCPKRPVCNVCAAVCLTETGAFDAVPDYACRMTDARIALSRARTKGES